MKPNNIGTIASRTLGVGLLLLGITSALFIVPIRASAGWTSYPPSSAATPETAIHDSYTVIVSSIDWCYLLPGLAQSIAGMCFLIFSRPIGRLLARGVTDGGEV